MARVPLIDAPQVAQRALPGARQESNVSSADFGGREAQQNVELGGALMNAGTAASNIAVRMQERENADRLFQVEQALKNDYLAFEKVARERTLANAYGLTRESTEWWDKAAEKHGENLTNDVQRRLFSQTVGKLRMASVHSISTHESSETRKSLEASSIASQVGSIDVSAAAHGNPALVASGQAERVMKEARGDITRRIEATASMNGWGPEVTQFKLGERLTQLHTQNIQAMVDRNPMAATAYYEANKAEIDGTKRDVIERTLKIGTQRLQAQRFADEVQVKGMTEADALIEARKRFDGEEEAAAVSEVNARFRQDAAAREGLQRKNADMAWDIYSQTGRYSSIPAEIISGMDGRDRLAIQREEQMRGRRDENETDWGVYYDLRQMAINKPAEFAKVDLRRHFESLGKAQRESLIDIQAKYKDPKEVADAATLSQQLSTVHNQLNWNAGDREKKGKLDAVVMREIDAEQQRAGKKLNYEDRQKIIDRMVIEGEVLSGKWYLNDPNRRVYEVHGTEDAARFAPKVPKEERAKIEAALKRAGKPVTDETVQELYRRKTGL